MFFSVRVLLEVCMRGNVFYEVSAVGWDTFIYLLKLTFSNNIVPLRTHYLLTISFHKSQWRNDWALRINYIDKNNDN